MKNGMHLPGFTLSPIVSSFLCLDAKVSLQIPQFVGPFLLGVVRLFDKDVSLYMRTLYCCCCYKECYFMSNFENSTSDTVPGTSYDLDGVKNVQKLWMKMCSMRMLRIFGRSQEQ